MPNQNKQNSQEKVEELGDRKELRVGRIGRRGCGWSERAQGPASKRSQRGLGANQAKHWDREEGVRCDTC